MTESQNASQNVNVPSTKLKLPKKLVVLCDGTWQNSDYGWEKDSWSPFDHGHPQVPTNVTRLGRALLPESSDSHPQIISYHAGVGSSSWSITDHLLGGGLAYGISSNIRDAYVFLVDNFMEAAPHVSDQIFLVGFSRGAFTARSIGGMISSIGLLHKDAMQYFYYIFQDYEMAGADKPHYTPMIKKAFPDFHVESSVSDAARFLEDYKKELVKRNLTRIVDIEAIAVWDTVGTLGLPVTPVLQKIGLPSAIHAYRFYDTGISERVRHAFHAMALDERRSAFNATVWERQADNKTTILKQVWFPGAHSNIGGGYENQAMADISLAWMMDQLDPFLDFDKNYLKKQNQALVKNFFAADGVKPTKQKPAFEWGLGPVYEGLQFPLSLLGSITRTPGRYFELDYQTGKPNSKNPKLLQNTNEYIHASVRARYQYSDEFGGFDAHGKPYKLSAALKNWELVTGKREDGTKCNSWRRNLAGDAANGRELPEAEIGHFESQLLDLDPAMKTKLFPTTTVAT
ncbi:hypothetical protein BT63DRAFT_409907 [Microthyrium microscopicum]|uniref:T6SS Phospholipase effector Tle1-like catalytic domain-containing protein n=1 Tax=Microthyrium microscopicum TaxID=703497 RepID=A0A6A6UKN4_9PEZI|nr:hypothetical protein BT63DRAFT_409907 [Microthyrium microscopicum]